MSNVKLAIRVRPFSDRELKSEKDRVPVVSVVDNHTVTITNIKVNVSGAGDSRERVRRYSADYTFDSSCPTTNPTYASQEKVFESIGREVVSSVARGSSACVLAYGQSATGKTHTMMGTEDQPGLIPRLCRAFAEEPLDITVSFLEIYNERVHDLLAGEPLPCQSLPRRRGNARKDLRVREHPERGPYVQNLRRVGVTDLETLLSLVEEGARRRRTAATRRNSSSSRSHALLELATRNSTLHLADLAGSEKASWEGCGGGRQKEGANINKSLVALSNVISALVSGGNRGRFVPYRDSALTWLLKDCFTGGASTFIIATVSPSVACYGESASTLRWAERARQLRKPRILSCGPSTASRTALQAQLNQLLAELARHHIRYNLQTGKITYDDNHWTLHKADNDNIHELLNTDAKIGNLLDMFTPKTDAQHSQNSESTASSVASGSSDVINTIDKNIKEEITKEVDKMLTPTFERTRSGSELEVIAPLRHRRRQYKSQEVLPIDKTLHLSQSTAQPSLTASQENITENLDAGKTKPPPVPILYDNQRAEIVASVTERLYSKLKKKEEAAVSKVENMVDKKIMEPLSELRICTNARQRLMEISQRAIRNKGRRIGIPAYTQTRHTVTRVRDQGVDVQSDLESYIFRQDRAYTLQRDVATETIPMTPRCKEIAVGPKCSSLNYRDRSTLTDTNKPVHRNSFMMTDAVLTSDRCSQTPVVAPPRRKRRAAIYSKCNDIHRCCMDEGSVPSVISINISQPYQLDSETQSSDDDIDYPNFDYNLQKKVEIREERPTNVSTTPDLLTNHNNVETSAHEDTDSEHFEEAENLNYNHVENFLDNVNVLPSLNLKEKETSPTGSAENKNCVNTNSAINTTILPTDNQDFIRENNTLTSEDKIPSKTESNIIKDATLNIANTSPNPVSSACQDDEFPEEHLEEVSLPRVTVVAARTINEEEMRDMILGRNENMYPYNIVLSPPRERDDTKRIVTFKDIQTNSAVLNESNILGSPTKVNYLKDPSTDSTYSETEHIENTSKNDFNVASSSDITDTSQVNSFVWKRCHKTKLNKPLPRGYTPVYKNNFIKHRSNARSKMYKEFLGLNINNNDSVDSHDENIGTSSESTDLDDSQYNFHQKRKYFEDKFKSIPNTCQDFDKFHKKLLKSCDNLDSAVNKYENYLANYHEYITRRNRTITPTRTPKEYLQHLIQLRREFVKTEYSPDRSLGK